MAAPGIQKAVRDLVHGCYIAGDELAALRSHLLGALRRVVPFDAGFLATSDPETLLFTTAFAEDGLVELAPLFLEHEFGPWPDVNRFAVLSSAAIPAASLDQLTAGERAASRRWREVMDPAGMGDELRLALRVDGATWGFMCLHRFGGIGFSEQEVSAAATVAPHAAEAIRRVAADGIADSRPGAVNAVIITNGTTILGTAGAVGDVGFEALAVGGELPLPLRAVVRRLKALDGSGSCQSASVAAIRIAAPDGGLLGVHAAFLHSADSQDRVALSISPATPVERSSLLLTAYGLTPAQRRVASLVVQGHTTHQIVNELRISAHTVQDHLKAVFDKVGVRSRRELVGALMFSATS